MKTWRIFLFVVTVALVSACSSGGDDENNVDPDPNPDPNPNTDFTVRAVTKTSAHPSFGTGHSVAYSINNEEGKELTLVRGTSYTFSVNTPGHPFYISTSSVGSNGGVGEVTDGVTNSQVASGTLTFVPNSNHPDLLYYQCAVHPNMGWKINIVDP